jgi:4-hydroxy-3-polyprenylbenzoate decarboxylase
MWLASAWQSMFARRRMMWTGPRIRSGADEAQIYEKLVFGMRNRIPSRVRQSGPVKDEIYHGEEVDLYKFPTPWWHEHDGGQSIATTAGLITRVPKSGNLNMGSYRAMIKDKNTVSSSGGTRGPRNPSGGDHILMNEAEGKPTPVAGMS